MKKLYLQINEPGSGEITVPLDSALATNLLYLSVNNMIPLDYLGTVLGFFFPEKIEKVLVGEGDKAVRSLKISGRGPLAILDDAVVWDWGTPDTDDVRQFYTPTGGKDFTTPMYHKGQILHQLIHEASEPQTNPSGDVMDRKCWTKPLPPIGHPLLLEHTFSDTADTDGVAWNTAENEEIEARVGTSYLDLARQFVALRQPTCIYTNVPTPGFNAVITMANTSRFTVGDVIVVSSEPDPVSGLGGGSEETTILSIVPNVSITVYNLVFTHTAYKRLIYPSVMDLGTAFEIIASTDNTRLHYPIVTVDIHQSQIGLTRSATMVHFRLGLNCLEVSNVEDRTQIRNAVLTEFNDKTVPFVSVYDDMSAYHTWRRREVILQASNASSLSEARIFGQALLAKLKDPTKSISVKVTDAVDPLANLKYGTDFNLGDWIWYDDGTGVEALWRIRGIQLEWDDDYFTSVVVELRQDNGEL